MQRSSAKSLAGLAGWLLLSFMAAGLGSMASVSAPEFYQSLDQPAWAPPAWLFGPVWTTLFILMAFSAWLVWRDRGFDNAKVALSLFVLQLVLNALWSWLFFVWHLGAWAFVEVLVLLMSILVVTLYFWKLKPIAALLLVPYLLWVAFASLLCYDLWQRNMGLL